MRTSKGNLNKVSPRSFPALKPRYSKFSAARTTVDGITFASKKEAKRYQELRLLEKVGEISLLRRQVPIKCIVNNELVCVYLADFEYIDKRNGQGLTREDAKGYRTPIYKLKRRLVKACTGIEILET